jgi:hypothetical protein
VGISLVRCSAAAVYFLFPKVARSTVPAQCLQEELLLDHSLAKSFDLWSRFLR